MCNYGVYYRCPCLSLSLSQEHEPHEIPDLVCHVRRIPGTEQGLNKFFLNSCWKNYDSFKEQADLMKLDPFSSGEPTLWDFFDCMELQGPFLPWEYPPREASSL